MGVIVIFICIAIIFSFINKKSNPSDKTGKTKEMDSTQEISKLYSKYYYYVITKHYKSLADIARDSNTSLQTVRFDLKRLKQNGYFKNMVISEESNFITSEKEVMEYSKSSSNSNTNQPVNQPVNRPVNRSVSQPVNQPVNRPVSQTVNEPMKKVNSKEKIIEGRQLKDESRHKSVKSHKIEKTQRNEEEDLILNYGNSEDLWKDVATEFSYGDDDNMKTCVKCGTQNIVIRDVKGICTCFYCGEKI